ncbi:hypothetical protein [Alteribacter populi]|uniref:hypothetical protein n=1 Tax=Alteribacter populi TaxID=2011011 RepID=UPI000BBAA815|nr:hypothetical protein [Alteribacter populi]
MIPVEVERRIAVYFFHSYLPEEVMITFVDSLIPACVLVEEDSIDHDELVRLAIEIIDQHFEEET